MPATVIVKTSAIEIKFRRTKIFNLHEMSVAKTNFKIQNASEKG